MTGAEKLTEYIDALAEEKRRINGTMTVEQAQRIAMLADCLKASTTAFFIKMRLRN